MRRIYISWLWIAVVFLSLGLSKPVEAVVIIEEIPKKESSCELDAIRLEESIKYYWELDDLWLETFLAQIPTAPVSEATGVMTKPSMGRISSPYSKTRVHPVFGAVRPHGGTDIAGSYGDLIRAADGGVVVYADSMYGYGNIVILNHGNGLTTFYAHQQKLAVSKGQRVEKGRLIGYVGSTGYSTGPHLHFEVRRGIEGLDPYDFISYQDE